MSRRDPMPDFPRTEFGGLSVPRLVIGTNWFLGFSHTTKAKDVQINTWMDRKRIADILEVFLKAGADMILGVRPEKKLQEATKDAEDRTGRKLINIGTPGLNTAGTPQADDENKRILDSFLEIDTKVLMPHQSTTDALLDRTTRSVRQIDAISKMIRERGMIPGLSTHMPEAIIYADETDADVESYVQIFNAAGFLMQVEVEWIHEVIQNANKPVITIKPLAAGRLTPLVGLTFVWNTIRDQDMVCLGTMTPDEAAEGIEMSLSILERRRSQVELQRTRSKASIEPKR
jgi:hypothetical protein